MKAYYLDMEDVLSLHQRQLELFGGAPGIRDAGLIEAALARPQSGYYRDRIEEAAALWESLTMNHGFIDGNKRVGFAACAVFLHMNGYRLVLSADEGEDFIVRQLIAEHLDVHQIAEWLKPKLRPLR